MNTFDEFRFQREAMIRRIKDKDNEYIRMDVMGIEAHQIVHHPDSGTIVVAGEDEAGKPSLIVMAAGHFYGKLTLDKKKKDRLVTGFNIEKQNEDQAATTISN